FLPSCWESTAWGPGCRDGSVRRTAAAAAADPHATSWLSAWEARRPSGVLGGRSWREGDDSAAAEAASRCGAAKARAHNAGVASLRFPTHDRTGDPHGNDPPRDSPLVDRKSVG